MAPRGARESCARLGGNSTGSGAAAEPLEKPSGVGEAARRGVLPPLPGACRLTERGSGHEPEIPCAPGPLVAWPRRGVPMSTEPARYILATGAREVERLRLLQEVYG